MKKFLNGKMVEMTAAELQKYEAVRAEVQESEPEHEITPEERIEALEETVRLLDEQLAAAKVLLGVE